MDAGRFDRLSRLVAHPASRRLALGLVAVLGLGVTTPDAGAKGKKRKNKCKGGCGPCKVCRKQGKKKTCVPAPSSATCAILGNVCGPAVADGCGGTLACGVCSPGATPSCANGACSTCAAACPASCAGCHSRTDGANVCGASGDVDCAFSCTTDADCPSSYPTCIAVTADRGTNALISWPTFCGTSAPGVCSNIAPC
jgi:hypothetical protein